jgi:predicted dehydrogenase
MRSWRVAGINFDHAHMGDLLREVHDHPHAEIVGICHSDLERMAAPRKALSIPHDRVFTDVDRCIRTTKPDLIILCPATAAHADWVETVAPYGIDILVEKPFAATLADADRMITAADKAGIRMAINWPLAWYPSHVTAKRLAEEGVIGRIIEVHYYDGNRGPLFHVADKIEVSADQVAEQKPNSWWYKKAFGGGSLLDYLGYGVTLGSWYLGGLAPIEVTTVVDRPAGLEVDEHSITICRYKDGLSKFETRWGTFTDPWTLQPQPKCGFVLVGSDGTISSYDYEKTIRLQTRAHPEQREIPVDELKAPRRAPVEYMLHCKETGETISGPLDPKLARIGQRIVDAAIRSAAERRSVELAR